MLLLPPLQLPRFSLIYYLQAAIITCVLQLPGMTPPLPQPQATRLK